VLVLHRITRVLAAGVSGCEARVRVLDGASLRVGPREIVALAGASACERTLVLLCAAGLARVDAGAVIARGRRRYLHAAELDPACDEEILLVDHADAPGAQRALARAIARGATILCAAADAAAFARASARVVTLRDGAFVEVQPRARVSRARVAERALR
jgi:ABC-type sulfate/molybdate transport systems ATPase subunit